MEEYRVSIAEYYHISSLIAASNSGIIKYDGYIFQDVGDEFIESIVCASEIDVLSGSYEWKKVVTPFDVAFYCRRYNMSESFLNYYNNEFIPEFEKFFKKTMRILTKPLRLAFVKPSPAPHIKKSIYYKKGGPMVV